MSARLFTQTVPRSERAYPDALDFYRALRSSATLRRAVEQIVAATSLDGDESLVTSSFPRMADERGNDLPGDSYRGGRPWTVEAERVVRRRCRDALVSWGFLTWRGGLTWRRARASIPGASAAAIAADLMRETRSAQAMLEHPAWLWLGLDRDAVLASLSDAEDCGLLRFVTGGGVSEIRFTAALREAVESAEH